MTAITKKAVGELKKITQLKPLIPYIESVQLRLKTQELTPMQKLSTSVSLTPDTSYDNFMQNVQTKFGSNDVDLYGEALDLSEFKPQVQEFVKNDTIMDKYRMCYQINWSLPGCVERINPNRFLRLKPVEEFNWLPILPVPHTRLKEFQQKIENKKKKLHSKVDRERIVVTLMMVGSLGALFALLQFLYTRNEKAIYTYEHEKERKKNLPTQGKGTVPML